MAGCGPAGEALGEAALYESLTFLTLVDISGEENPDIVRNTCQLHPAISLSAPQRGVLMTNDILSSSDLTQAVPDAADMAVKLVAELRREILAGDDQILSRGEAAAFLNRNVKTLEAWAKVGSGPRVTRFGPKSIGYRLGDLREYVRNPAQK